MWKLSTILQSISNLRKIQEIRNLASTKMILQGLQLCFMTKWSPRKEEKVYKWLRMKH